MFFRKPFEGATHRVRIQGFSAWANMDCDPPEIDGTNWLSNLAILYVVPALAEVTDWLRGLFGQEPHGGFDIEIVEELDQSDN